MLAAPSTATDDSALRAAVESCGASLAGDVYGPQALRDDSGVSFERLRSGAVALLPEAGLHAWTGAERGRVLPSMNTDDAKTAAHSIALLASWAATQQPAQMEARS